MHACIVVVAAATTFMKNTRNRAAFQFTSEQPFVVLYVGQTVDDAEEGDGGNQTK